MDSGKYIDFSEDCEPNTIWNFIPTTEGVSFRKYTLSHARLGDSDSIYCCFPEELTKHSTSEDIIGAADAVADFVNSSYPDFLKHAFNCPASRTHHVESNREIVADSILVMSKKRYAAHVINDEGESTDKIKILGLETKKSDTPEFVKNALYQIIAAILEGKDKSHLDYMIRKFEREYRHQNLKDIARPISVKGLKFYNDEYEMTGSEKGFPYNVRAARYYNSLCGPSDRKIMPGEKVGILYIKSRESKYIAFPIDINEFPSFMNDIVIDYKTQWEKAHKKIVSYMSAVGWDFQSQKEEKREKLFGF